MKSLIIQRKTGKLGSITSELYDTPFYRVGYPYIYYELLPRPIVVHNSAEQDLEAASDYIRI